MGSLILSNLTTQLSTYLTGMWLLPSVNSFMLDFLVRSGKPTSAMLALIGFLAIPGFRCCHYRCCRRCWCCRCYWCHSDRWSHCRRSRRYCWYRCRCCCLHDSRNRRSRRLWRCQFDVHCGVHRQTIRGIKFPVAYGARHRVARMQRHVRIFVWFR